MFVKFVYKNPIKSVENFIDFWSMSYFQVGHRIFKKNFPELYIGSSVVAGNPDSVRDKETREKGTNIEKTTYKVVDNLTLVEVYKGFQVYSNVASNVVYEILYDALEGEVKGILCGIKEDDGIAYYALVPRGTKSIKKHIAFYIDYVDFGLIPAIQREIEETLSFNEQQIRETYGNPPERIYAGSFIGSSSEGLVLIPFATYKANEVIPAYMGEEDERIHQLEIEIEEINSKLTSNTEVETEEYKNLLEKKKILIKELAKLRNKLYNPDILKAIKNKGERLFITQKPEIRYLGENLLQTAYTYKDLTITGEKKIKGVFAILTLPVYNNLTQKLQKGYLEVFLSLYSEGELYPLELQKARQTIFILDEALREFIKSLEGGIKPNLSHLKERIKDNLSLRKRLEDIEKFVISKLDAPPEELEANLNLLRELKQELEKGRRILYSPFTISKLVTPYEILSLLQESGVDTTQLTKDDWEEIYTTVDTLNETLENTFKSEFKNELKGLVKFFLRKLEGGKPIHYRIYVKGQVEEGYYPSPERGLSIEDLYPNRVLINLIRGALKKVNALEKLSRLEEVEIFFGDRSVRLGQYALTAFVRKVFASVAKSLLASVDYNREEEIKALREFLIQNWLGEFKKQTEAVGKGETEGTNIELDDEDFDAAFFED